MERMEGIGVADKDVEEPHSSHAKSWQWRQTEALIWKEEQEVHRGDDEQKEQWWTQEGVRT